MKLNLLVCRTLICGLFMVGASAGAQAIPHLQKHEQATQLIVDGKPFLVLGGELANTASSSSEYMKPVWPRVAQMHLNTVLTGMSWAQFEPEEGHYNYELVDRLLAGARQQNLKIIFLWFGSWKNGISSFAPSWVKQNQHRFPRVQITGGRSIEVLSTLSEANLNADSTAYAALMRHLREVDSQQHTVIMIQMENEVGVLGDTRDRSLAANAAFDRPVPQQLMRYITAHKTILRPELLKLWIAAGEKTSGTWTEVFGKGASTDEIFMAWNYARYMNAVTRAGKAEYPIPVYTNTWLVQPEDNEPGDYPSGGPEPQVLDIWTAGSPDIDIHAPDIYLPDFEKIIARFHQNGNPLFVPESRGDALGVAHAFYAIGDQDSIGYSPMGIDQMERLVPVGTVDSKLDNLPLTKGYDVLRQLTPLILDHQGNGSMKAIVLEDNQHSQSVLVGNYTVTVDVAHNRRTGAIISTPASPSYALIIATGPDEYIIAANSVEITFTPRSPGPAIAGLAQVQAGNYIDGKWVPGRWLNGDDVLLNYKLAQAAADSQSGSGLKFGPNGPTIQAVKLYRYE